MGREKAMAAPAVSSNVRPNRETEAFRTSKQSRPVDWEAILAEIPGAKSKTVTECGAGHDILRLAPARAITDCILDRVDRRSMVLMLHELHDVSELFVRHLLEPNIRYEQDLVHQLFNSNEKRLARTLLMLAHFGKESRTETIVPKINQESLAQMVGTTRSWINHFMNKFKNLGFVDYNGKMKLTVNSSLLGVLLHD